MFSPFIQIHTLTSYPGALLNRDDAGFAKRLPFGGAVRTRVSSQCLKRHWRTFSGEHALAELDAPGSVRSRLTFERYVVQPLVDAGKDEALVRAVTDAFMGQLLGASAKAKEARKAKGPDADQEALKTGQITVLGRPEVEFIRAEVATVCEQQPKPKKAADAVKRHLGKDGRKNLQALRLGAGLDAALFGRMVTSDILSRVDAAIHVAHAITVHGEHAETDYFSAIDDLVQGEDGELGSGHINTTELTSGLFYGYVVADVPLLVSNIEGCKREGAEQADRTLAAQVVRRLIHLVATVSPGAKLGSTAPHGYSSLVLVEAGKSQPRSLANAFLRPVPERDDLLANAYEALGVHVADLDRMYGRTTERRLAAVGDVDELGKRLGVSGPEPLDAVASWTASQVGPV